MKKIYITFIISLICIRSLSQIEGDVRSSDDKRLSKAVIIAMDSLKTIIDSTISADNGFYSFTKLKPGVYIIEAKAQGFETRLYKNVIARKNFLPPGYGDDRSSATRLQIVLSPIKKPKQ